MLIRLKGPRRGKGIVDNEQNARLSGNGLHAGNIGNPQRRVRDNLGYDHPRFGPYRSAQGIQITRINQASADTQARQIFVHHPQRAPVQQRRANHMITGIAQAKQHSAYGSHPRSGDDPRLRCVFHPVNPGGDHIGIGVPFTRIGIPRHITGILRIQHVWRVRGIDNRR